MESSTIKGRGKALLGRVMPGLFRRLQMRYGDAGLQGRLRGAFAGLDGTVLAGPFAGMRYSAAENAHWFNILGSYEQELHAAVERLAARPPRAVINVGCADGYYAVGLARRCPASHVYAFDALPEQQALCRRLAEANGVADRVTVGGACDLETLRGLPLEGALIVSDCEGCELDLLRPDLLPGLARCDLLVELHDMVRPGLTEALLPRFAVTHRAELVPAVERDPDAYPALRGLSRRDRRYALREGRTLPMQWAVLTRAPARAG